MSKRRCTKPPQCSVMLPDPFRPAPLSLARGTFRTRPRSPVRGCGACPAAEFHTSSRRWKHFSLA